MIETAKFQRKPFEIEAVQVTEENLEDVAKWCDGVVETHGDSQHIKVRVHRPLNERQTKAFVGDWVLYAGTGYKVYTDKAFKKSFEPAKKPIVVNQMIMDQGSINGKPGGGLSPYEVMQAINTHRVMNRNLEI